LIEKEENVIGGTSVVMIFDNDKQLQTSTQTSKDSEFKTKYDKKTETYYIEYVQKSDTGEKMDDDSSKALRRFNGGFDVDGNPQVINKDGETVAAKAGDIDDKKVPITQADINNARGRAAYAIAQEQAATEKAEERTIGERLTYIGRGTAKVFNEAFGRLEKARSDLRTPVNLVHRDKVYRRDANGEVIMEPAKDAKGNAIYEIDKDGRPVQKMVPKEFTQDYGFWESGGRYVIAFFQDYKPQTEASNLLFEGKGFEKWKEDVDRTFSKVNLGTDYWSSEMCKSEFDVIGDSVLVLENTGGTFQFLGRIEGERSGLVPVICNATGECQTGSCRTFDNACVNNKNTADPSDDTILKQFFYKITYGVTAPSDQKLTPNVDEESAISFNILLTGKAESKSIFSDFIHLENGQPKRDVIVKYSSIEYDKLCLIFGKKAVDRHGKKIDQICNTMQLSEKSFVNFQNNAETAASASSREPTLTTDW
jgi:hypothetical protein